MRKYKIIVTKSTEFLKGFKFKVHHKCLLSAFWLDARDDTVSQTDIIPDLRELMVDKDT